MEIKTAFNLGELVKIKDLDYRGRVVTIRITGTLWTEYEVGYFHQGERKFVWMIEDELDPMATEAAVNLNGASGALASV